MDKDTSRPPTRRPRVRKPLAVRQGSTPAWTPLDPTRDELGRYMVFPDEHALDAVTLWVAATHAQGAWDHATRLIIRSPVKRCGKSRLLDLVCGLCRQPLLTANTSVAALVYSIDEKDPPTILVDEADTIFGRGRRVENSEDLRGLLNAGFQRNRPYIRWDYKARRREERPTFAMAAMAGIGKLPDTVEDRAVIISVRRRRRDEKVEQFRVRDIPKLQPVRDELAKWLGPNLDVLKAARPTMAPLEDRAADVWEPLYAVADLAGGLWPMRAREAAKAMTAGSEEDEAELLLLHVYGAFQDDGSGKLTSHDLVEALFDRQDGPWAAMWARDVTSSQSNSGVWNRDYRVVYSKLAGMLKAFGIAPTKIKIATGQALQGYRREDFADTWTRLGIGDGTTGTKRTPKVKRVRGRTSDGTETEPGHRGSGEVPSEVPFRMAMSRGVPGVPSVPSVLSSRGHLQRVR
jgi:Protein of unknown function (DUF3631)